MAKNRLRILREDKMADLEEINERHEKPIRNKIGLLDKILMGGIILGTALMSVPLYSKRIEMPAKVQRHYQEQTKRSYIESIRTELSDNRVPDEVRQKTFMIIEPAIDYSKEKAEELKKSEEFKQYQEQVDARNRRHSKYWFSGMALVFGIPTIISICGIYNSLREIRKIKENQAHQGEV